MILMSNIYKVYHLITIIDNVKCVFPALQYCLYYTIQGALFSPCIPLHYSIVCVMRYKVYFSIPAFPCISVLFVLYDVRCIFRSLQYSIVCIIRYKVHFSIPVFPCITVVFVLYDIRCIFLSLQYSTVLFALYDTRCTFLFLHSPAVQFCLYYTIQGILFYPCIPLHFSIVCIIRHNVHFQSLHFPALQYCLHYTIKVRFSNPAFPCITVLFV